MKYLAALILIGIVSCTLTKNTNEAPDIKLEALTDSIASVYASSILIEDLYRDLSILASDEYEGRETARPGQKKAAKYITERLQTSNKHVAMYMYICICVCIHTVLRNV